MSVPAIEGRIRRRLLVNFRIDPKVIRPLVPGRFEIVTVDGAAVAGICLIRLEGMRPSSLPVPAGLASDNAAYRVAVRWQEGGVGRDGVFVMRRDTGSAIQHRLGGRLFPGDYRRAAFDADDDGLAVAIACRSADGTGDLSLVGHASDTLPAMSVFRSLSEASAFFERGSDGYSGSRDARRLDGIRLDTASWTVRPFEVEHVASAFFDDPRRFPAGSVAFDDALVMRDVAHAWRALPRIEPAFIGR